MAVGSSGSGPIPGTTQYPDAVIEKASPPRTDAEMSFGVFTTSTMMSRNIKVSSIMKNDVMPLIETTWKVSCHSSYAPQYLLEPPLCFFLLYCVTTHMLIYVYCLQKLYQNGNSVRGSHKFRDLGDVVYIRLGSISDAPTVYNALSKDHDNIAVEYVSVNAVNKVRESCLFNLFNC